MFCARYAFLPHARRGKELGVNPENVHAGGYNARGLIRNASNREDIDNSRGSSSASCVFTPTEFLSMIVPAYAMNLHKNYQFYGL